MSISKKILGFSDSDSIMVADGQDPIFFNLIKQQIGKANPNICYIGAAKGDCANRASVFSDLCQREGAMFNWLNVFGMTGDDPDTYFVDMDAVFIDGGVTRNLVALLNEWNVLPALRKAYADGVLISGASAGISMFFEGCVTDSIKTDLRAMAGIGLLRGSITAHFDNTQNRKAIFDKALTEDKLTFPAYGLDEGTAALFINGECAETYSLRNSSNVYMRESEVTRWTPMRQKCG